MICLLCLCLSYLCLPRVRLWLLMMRLPRQREFLLLSQLLPAMLEAPWMLPLQMPMDQSGRGLLLPPDFTAAYAVWLFPLGATLRPRRRCPTVPLGLLLHLRLLLLLLRTSMTRLTAIGGGGNNGTSRL